MSVFVILPDGARERIYEVAISQTIKAQIPLSSSSELNQSEIASMCDEMITRHELWCYDERNNSETRVRSFLAIESAFTQLNLVRYRQMTPDVEEWHIVEITKKHGFSPWA